MRAEREKGWRRPGVKAPRHWQAPLGKLPIQGSQPAQQQSETQQLFESARQARKHTASSTDDLGGPDGQVR